MEEIDMAETLKSLSAKLNELSNALNKKKVSNVLNKKKVSNVLVEKKDIAIEKIAAKPFAYLGGAFFGGLAMGYLVSRKRKTR